MKRTTITLPDDLAMLVEREARRRSTSVSELVRQVLALHLGTSQTAPRYIPFANLGASGHSDTARNLRKILAE